MTSKSRPIFYISLCVPPFPPFLPPFLFVVSRSGVLTLLLFSSSPDSSLPPVRASANQKHDQQKNGPKKTQTKKRHENKTHATNKRKNTKPYENMTTRKMQNQHTRTLHCTTQRTKHNTQITTTAPKQKNKYKYKTKKGPTCWRRTARWWRGRSTWSCGCRWASTRKTSTRWSRRTTSCPSGSSPTRRLPFSTPAPRSRRCRAASCSPWRRTASPESTTRSSRQETERIERRLLFFFFFFSLFLVSFFCFCFCLLHDNTTFHLLVRFYMVFRVCFCFASVLTFTINRVWRVLDGLAFL